MGRLDDIVARNQQQSRAGALAVKWITIPMVLGLVFGVGWFAKVVSCSRDSKVERWCDAAESWLKTAIARVDTAKSCAELDDIYVRSRDGLLPQLEDGDTRLDRVRPEVIHLRDTWGYQGEPLQFAVQFAHHDLPPALAHVLAACAR